MALSFELDLDDNDFTSKLTQAGQAVDVFESKTKTAGSTIKVLEGNSKSLLSTLRDVTVVLGLTHQAMGMIDSVSTSWVRQIVGVNAEFERMVTIMRSLSTAQDPLKEATTSVTKLREMAKDAPFSLNAIHDAFVRLNAAGLEPMKGTMQSLLDAVAAFGGGDAELGRAALAFQEMAGKGVVQMKELRNQLMMAVPSAARLMARSVGESYGEMMTDIHTGTVDAKSTIQALQLEFERAFGGAAQRQMETFNGQIGRMKVLLQDIAIQSVGKPLGADGLPNADGFYETVKQQMKDFNEFLAGGAGGHGIAQGLGNELGSALTSVVLDLREGIELVAKFHTEIEAAGEALAIAFGISVVRGIFTTFASSITGVMTLMKTMQVQIATGMATVSATKPQTQWAGMQKLYASQAAAAATADVASATSAEAAATAAEATRLAALAESMASRALMTTEQAAAKAEVAAAAVAAATRAEQESLAAQAALKEATAASGAGEMAASASVLGRNGKIAGAFMPLLVEGLSAFSVAAMVALPVIGFLSDYFDIFNSRAREGWQNLEHYGAASKEAADGANAFLNVKREELRVMEADRASRLAAEGILGNANAAHASADPELEAKRKELADLERKAGEWQLEGLGNDAQRISAKAMQLVDADIQKIKLLYNQSSDAAAKAFDAQLKIINNAHQSAALATADYQTAQRDRVMSDYDSEIAKLEEYKAKAEEVRKTSTSPSDQMAADSFILNLEERGQALKTQRDEYAKQPMGFQLNKKVLPDDKLMEKASEEIQKLYASIDGYKAGIEGADASAEQLYQTWLRLGKAGDSHVGMVAEAIVQMKELKTQADDYENIISGGHKLEKDLTDLIDKDNNTIFDDLYGKLSGYEQIMARKARGEYPGQGGTTPDQLRLVAMREELDKAQKAAVDAGKALQDSFGVTLAQNITTVNDALNGTSSALLSIVNGTAKSGLFNQPAASLLNGSIMAGPRATAPSGPPPTDWAQGINFGNAGPFSAKTSPSDPLQDDVKSALHALEQMAGAFTITSTTQGDHAKDSEHYKGEAVDIAANNSMSGAQYIDLVTKAIEAGFTRVGVSDSHLHLDMGKTGAFADSGGEMGRAGMSVAQIDALVKQIAANRSVVNAPESETQKNDRLAETARTLQPQVEQANANKALMELFDKFSKMGDVKSLEAEGSGTELSKLIAWIKENGQKTSFGTNNSDDPRYQPFKDAASAADEAKKQADAFKTAITDAETAAKASAQKLVEGREALANDFTKLAHGADGASDALLKVREEGQRNVSKAVTAYGAGSPQAAQAQSEADQNSALQQDQDIMKAAEAAQKKTEIYRESTMSQEQADVAKYNALAQEYQRDLANFTGTEEQKAVISKQFNAALAADWAAMQAKTPFAKQMQDWADSTKNLQQATSSFMNSAVDNLATQIMTGKANWASFAASIEKDLLEIAMKGAASGLLGGMGSLLGGGGGSKGAPMQLAGAVGGGSKMGGGGGGSKLTTLFGVATHHTGGIVGGASGMRYMSLASLMSSGSPFANAPRFHSGGIVGVDEVPIIAKKNEGVFTQEQMKALGRSNNQVTLHNNVIVNANGGRPEDNADLAAQVGAHVERIARSTVVDELRQQMRPGNLLFG